MNSEQRTVKAVERISRDVAFFRWLVIINITAVLLETALKWGVL